MIGPAGELIALGNPVVSGDDQSVELPVDASSVSPGTYSLRWAVTSATDGHDSSGLILFSVGTGRAPPEAFLSTSSRGAWWEIGAEAVLLLALASLAAILLLPMVGLRYRGASAIAVGLVALVAATVTAIEPAGPPPSSRAGQIRLAAGVLALAATTGAWRTRFATATGWIYWVTAVIAVTASGHAAGADRPAIAILLTATHTLIALMWAGAALAFTWQARREKPLVLMGRLERIGFGRLALLIGAGVAASAWHLPGDRAVTTSLYGRMLLLELLLVILVLALAAANRWVVGPWVHRIGADGQSRAILAAEAGALAAVIIFAAALSGTSAPAGRSLVNVAPRATAVDQSSAAGDLRIGVSGQIAGTPEDRLTVTVRDAAGETPAEIQRVILATSYRARPDALLEEGERFDAESVAEHAGQYEFPAIHLGRTGLWVLEVIVRRAGLSDVSAPFAIDSASWQRASPRLQSAAWRWPVVPLGAWLLIGLALLVPVVAIWAIHRYGPLAPVSGAIIIIAVAMIATGFGIQALQRTSARTGGHELAMPSGADPVAATENWTTYCLTYHGESGGGVESPNPLHQHGARADLTDRNSRLLSDGDLYWLITNGIGGTQMPAFGVALTEQERWDLVAYIRQFQEASP